MLGVTTPAAHARRRRPGTATAAYSLALAVTGDAGKSTAVAITALRRGAGSRTAVMAHARSESIAKASSKASLNEIVSSSDLRSLADQLASTRPAVERAIVNLELRCGLDTGSFARVLGLTTARALARSRAVAQSWATELDPAMMAWLGPGSCEVLATVLMRESVWPRGADTPMVSSVDTTGPIPILKTGTDGALIEPIASPVAQPITVGALLAAGPAVYEHTQTCDVCAERLRLLTPVRTLVGQYPLVDVPPLVAEAAHTARRRLPAPLPPSIEPRRLDVARLQVPALVITIAVVVIAAAIAIIANSGGGRPSQASRVAKLVNSAPASRLLATPTIITPSVKTAALANNGTQVINWHASSNQPWITLSPSSGRLQPSQSISIAVKASAPTSGVTDATITITGDDGSVQTLKYDTDGG